MNNDRIDTARLNLINKLNNNHQGKCPQSDLHLIGNNKYRSFCNKQCRDLYWNRNLSRVSEIASPYVFL